MFHVTIKAGYIKNNIFYETRTPWFSNGRLRFSEAVKLVKRGENINGTKIEYTPETKCVQVQKVYKNYSHGEIMEEYTLFLNQITR